MGNEGKKLNRFSENEKRILCSFVKNHKDEGRVIARKNLEELTSSLAGINGGIFRTKNRIWDGLIRFGGMVVQSREKEKKPASAESTSETLQKILSCLSRSHAKVDKAIRRLLEKERKIARQEKKDLQQRLKLSSEEIRRLKDVIKEKDEALRKVAKIRAAIEEVQAKETVHVRKGLVV